MVKHLTRAILVIACLVMSAMPAPAADVYFEDWESANSQALTNYNTGGAGTFQLQVSTNSNHTPGGSYSLNDHDIDLGGEADWVSTGPLDASGVTGTMYASFYYRQNSTSNFEDDDWLRVRWSTDGSTWNTVWETNDDPPNTAWRYGIVPMPPAAVSATLYLRFEMDDSSNNERWYLDDIYVGDAPPDGGDYSVARVSNLGYPAGGGTITNAVTLTLDGSGGPGPSFVCTETLPLDLTNVVPAASLGSAIVTGSNEIVWTFPGALEGQTLPQTLTYTCDVPSTACLTDFPTQGVFDDGYRPMRNVIGGPWGSEGGVLGMNYDLATGQAGGMLPSDGLAASSLVAAGANLFNYDVGWGGDPRHPGDGLWYGCLNGYAVYGGGSDIWDNGDHFQFLCFAVEGDFEIAADCHIVQPFNTWTKAGLMARQNLGSRAIYYMQRFRGGNGQSDAQWRLEEDNDNSTSVASGGTPMDAVGRRARLHMKREGTTISLGWQDLDDPANSAPVGTYIEDSFPELPNRVLLGFPVTSRSNDRIAWATFSNVETTATFSTYAPIGVPARSFGVTSYYPGTSFTVSVDVPLPADGSVTVVENVPPGVAASNISAGGTLNGDQITWVVAATAPTATVSYDAIAQLPQRPLNFRNGWAEDEMLLHRDTPDSLLLPQGTIPGATFQQGVFPDPSYAGCADNHIIENTVLSNQGAWDHAEEGDWRGTTDGTGLDDHRKILIKFDLSSLAPGFEASVRQALLGLYFDGQRRDGITHEGHFLSAARVLKEWNEGTGWGSDGPTALPGESNWISAQSGAVDWETSGAMGVTDVDDFEPATWWDAVLNHWVMLDVTQSTKNMIATGGATDDQGWKVSQDKLRGNYDFTPGNEYVMGAYDAASAQNGQPWRRPMLILLDNTAYAAPSAAARTAPTTYTWGVAIPIRIDVTHGGGPGSPLTITEDLPSGLDASHVSNISNGGSVVGSQIVWNIATFTANLQVTYDLTIAAGDLAEPANEPELGYVMFPLVIPGGTVEDDAGSFFDLGSSTLRHDGVYLLQDGVLPDPSYTGCQDAFIITAQKDNNTGGTPIMEEGDWDGRQLGTGTGDHKKMLVRFDLTGVTIPPSEVYAGARLWLYLLRQERPVGSGMYDPNNPGFDPWEHAGNQDHALFVWPLLKSWNEGDKNDRNGLPAGDNEVTWNYANTPDTVVPTPGTPWQIPGAMGATDVFSTYESVTWIEMPTTASQDIGIWVALDVSQSVEQYLANPALNNGWKICQDGGERLVGVPDDDPANTYEMGVYQFVSSENAQADRRPLLEIITDVRVPVEVSKFVVW